VVKFYAGEVIIQKSSINTKIKLCCFFVSFILHAVLLFWLYHTRVTIDTDPFGWEVKNVLISPVKKIYFSPTVKEQETYPSFVDEQARSSDETSELPAPIENISGQLLADSVSLNDNRSEYPDFIPKSFRLELPEDYLSNLPEDYDFDLTIKKQIIFPEYDYNQKDNKDLSLDINKYLYSPRGVRGGNSSGSLSAGVLRGRGRLLELNGIDIYSWGSDVVEKIQNNWLLSTEDIKLMDNPVKVSVILEKSGKMRSLDVLSSSNDEKLDRSALNAIRMSLPLPELPEKYPEDTLEIILVFAIHE